MGRVIDDHLASPTLKRILHGVFPRWSNITYKSGPKGIDFREQTRTGFTLGCNPYLEGSSAKPQGKGLGESSSIILLS